MYIPIGLVDTVAAGWYVLRVCSYTIMVRYTIRHIALFSHLPCALGGWSRVDFGFGYSCYLLLLLFLLAALQAVPKRAGSTAVDEYVTAVVSLGSMFLHVGTSIFSMPARSMDG
jgi:hypothetical protein